MNRRPATMCYEIGTVMIHLFLSGVYLWLGLTLLVCTIGVVAPRVYGRTFAAISSIPSMILALFLPQFMGFGVLLTLFFRFLGALRGPVGELGLLLHLVSWGLLLHYLWRVHYACPVLDGKVVLDDDHPFIDGVPEEELRQLPAGRISWRPSLTYRIPAMLAVDVIRNVVFRDVSGVKLRLDVYRPRRSSGLGDIGGVGDLGDIGNNGTFTPAPAPTAIYIHGGGWVAGNRRQSQFMLYELAAAGWAVFSISYRFAPRFPLPAAVEDCKAAVAWVRGHGAEYGAQTDDLVVIGGSAGGHLASLVALTPNDPRFQPGFEAEDTSTSGAVIFYGVSDFESAFSDPGLIGFAHFQERVLFKSRYRDDPAPFRLLQPLSHLSKDAPPMLLIHGENDSLVPIESSRSFCRKLREAGAGRVHLLEVPLGGHAFEVTPGPLHQRTVRVILRFLASVRAGWTTARPAASAPPSSG